jgi:hypothetical protein
MTSHPMSTFDPSQPSLVHDRRHDRTFEWQPQWAAEYQRFARRHAPGVMNWHGVLLDGWRELPQAPTPQRTRQRSGARTGAGKRRARS